MIKLVFNSNLKNKKFEDTHMVKIRHIHHVKVFKIILQSNCIYLQFLNLKIKTSSIVFKIWTTYQTLTRSRFGQTAANRKCRVVKNIF